MTVKAVIRAWFPRFKLELYRLNEEAQGVYAGPPKTYRPVYTLPEFDIPQRCRMHMLGW